MVKQVVFYLYNGLLPYYSDIRNNEISFDATWIKLEGVTLSEVSQDEKDKNKMISPICGTYKLSKGKIQGETLINWSFSKDHDYIMGKEGWGFPVWYRCGIYIYSEI